ncbi:hypothetical protein MW887_009922 [Aspergillus wentii]|nr:hypothetical protein MW887_009922 [Aspergillus wentii]
MAQPQDAVAYGALPVEQESQGYGAQPVDRKAYEFLPSVQLAPGAAKTLSPSADISYLMTPVKTQNGLKSCVAFGVVAILESLEYGKLNPLQEQSETFSWSRTKRLEGRDPRDNAGVVTSNALTIAQVDGNCWEKLCDYKKAPFAEPSEAAVKSAQKMKAQKPITVQSLETIKGMIDDENNPHPVLLQFKIVGTESQQASYIRGDTEKDGYIKMPDPNWTRTDGHCVAVVGYDDNNRHGNLQGYLKLKNSWGIDKGDHGYYFMPYDFFHKYSEGIWYIPGQEFDLGQDQVKSAAPSSSYGLDPNKFIICPGQSH